MSTFKVVWEIDIDADSPTEAAKIAWDVQRDPASIATVFEVIDKNGKRHEVDLEVEP